MTANPLQQALSRLYEATNVLYADLTSEGQDSVVAVMDDLAEAIRSSNPEATDITIAREAWSSVASVWWKEKKEQ